MTVAARFAFRPATLADLELMRCWQGAPQVRAWWDDEDPNDDADVADPRLDRVWMAPAGQEIFG